MTRCLPLLLFASAFAISTSSALAQSPYPYPYGPMPAQYAPPGYPMPAPYPMPYPQQMVMRPVYYPAPQPMMRPATMVQAPSGPRIYNFGPLTETTELPTTKPMLHAVTPTPTPATPASFGKTLPLLPKIEHKATPAPSVACGPDCGEPACGPACDPIARGKPLRGKGHFIGEVGSYFIVPYPGTRTAFSRTTGAATSTTDFPHELFYGPRASIGYVFHNCWGLRGNYWYMTGSENASVASSAGSTLSTPGATPFIITSPSATLTAGLGTDVFNLRQRLNLHVADVELIREAQVFDTNLLFGAGGRFARITQSYHATRTNNGGINAATSVALDQEDLDTSSRFEGWGPTVYGEVSHPLTRWGLSAYASARGSFLWGQDRFNQTYRNQNRTVTAAGVATFTDTTTGTTVFDNRTVTILDAEAGLQIGHRFGRCYVYGKAGGVFQRWWDVGTPTSANGNLNFFGGAASVGVIY